MAQTLKFWKTFVLSKLAKARVVEIFMASRLWYVARFYSMMTAFIKQVQTLFFAYINYPRPTATVSQQELIKLRLDGGIKLIDVATKANVSKCMWLINLITNPDLHKNLSLTAALQREKDGLKQGIDPFFSPPHYVQYKLRHLPPFYREAITASSKFELQQHIPLTAVPQ